VQSTIPYSESLQRLYAAKVESLRASAPILRGITRREVLQLRMQRIQKDVSAAVEGAVAASSTASTAQQSPLRGLGSAGSLAAAVAAAGDPAARLAHVSRLQVRVRAHLCLFSDVLMISSHHSRAFVVQSDYAAARTELDTVTATLRKDVAAFETSRGEPFLYQGRRLADALQHADDAESVLQQ
jgi:hypothetical protein